jgi:prepilin-type N-terminal cleavage/methylation domain-containing protein
MKRPAFNLVELVICLSVMAIFAAIGPTIANGLLNNWHLQAASRGLVSDLRQLQAQAICRHETLTFNPAQFKLPAGIIFSKTSPIAFAASGQTPPGGSGTLILSNRLGQSRKVIVSSAGRIRRE